MILFIEINNKSEKKNRLSLNDGRHAMIDSEVIPARWQQWFLIYMYRWILHLESIIYVDINGVRTVLPACENHLRIDRGQTV